MHAQYIGTHMGLWNIPSTFDGLLHYGTVTPKGQRQRYSGVVSVIPLLSLMKHQDQKSLGDKRTYLANTS